MHVGGEVLLAPAVAKLDQAFLLSTVCVPSINGFNHPYVLYNGSNLASILVDERDALARDSLVSTVLT